MEDNVVVLKGSKNDMPFDSEYHRTYIIP